MAMIELDGISRSEATHDVGDGSIAGLKQQMEVVRDKRPGKATSRRYLQDVAQTQKKAIAICVIEEDLSPLDATTDDVVACSRSVYAGLSRHDEKVATPLLH